MRNVWSTQRNWFWFSAISKDRTLGPRNLGLTYKLLIKFSYSVLPMLRRQRRSNIESLRTSSGCNGHVLEPYSSNDLTAAVNTQPVVGKWMASWHHRCLKLVNTHRTFRVRVDISSDVQPPNMIWLPKWIYRPTSPYSLSTRANFGFDPVSQQHFKLWRYKTHPKQNYNVVQGVEDNMQFIRSVSQRCSHIISQIGFVWANIDGNIFTWG